MASQTQVLGTLPINRKEYSPTVSYYKDNVVMHNNCAYYCKVTGPISNSEPSLENTNWGLWSGTPITQDLGDSNKKVISQQAATKKLSPNILFLPSIDIQTGIIQNPNINTKKKTIEFGDNFSFYIGKEEYGANVISTREVPYGGFATTSLIMVLNLSESVIKCIPHDAHIDINEYVIAFIRSNEKNISIDAVFSEYTIDNVNVVRSPNAYLLNTDNNNVAFNINSTTKELELGNSFQLYLEKEVLIADIILTHNISYNLEEPGGPMVLVFDYNSKEIYFITWTQYNSKHLVLLGALLTSYGSHNYIRATFPFEYTIDGKYPYALTKDIESLSTKVKSIEEGDNIFFLDSADGHIPNINTNTKMIEFGDSFQIRVGTRIYGADRVKTYNVSYDYETPTSAGIIVFDESALTITCQPWNYVLSKNKFLMGTLRLTYGGHKFVSMNSCFDYTIDGNVFLKREDSAIKNIINSEVNKKNFNDNVFFLDSSGGCPNINTKTKEIELGNSFQIRVGSKTSYGADRVLTYNISYDISIPTSAILLVFHESNLTITCQAHDLGLTKTDFILGTIRAPGHVFQTGNFIFDYTIDGKSRYAEDTKGTIVEYSGEPITLKPKCVRTYLDVAPYAHGAQLNTGITQGMTIYNDRYLFQGYGKTSSQQPHILVFDLVEKSYIRDYVVGIGLDTNFHNNLLTCGNKFSEDDMFPLLYVNETYQPCRCFVYRLSNNDSTYEVKQTISYSGTKMVGGAGYDWIVDLIGDCLYVLDETRILKFRLPKIDEGDVVFSDSDVLNDWPQNPNINVAQGAEVINGKLFAPIGYGNSASPAKILVFDPDRGKWISEIKLGNYEPEDVSIFNDTLVIARQGSLLYEVLSF